MTLDVVTIRRQRMRGDVLLCTPIVRAVKEKMHPSSFIFFETDFPEILKGNPLIKMAGRAVPRQEPFIYDLGIHFERLPNWHIIDALALGAGFKPGQVPHKLEMFIDRPAQEWQRVITSRLRDYIVLAPGPGLWPGRNWSEAQWNQLATKLIGRNENIVLVGTDTQYSIPAKLDLRKRTPSFSQLGAIIKGAKLFIGIDSFPVHVAGAMNTPRVAVFGVTKPECILCDSPHTYPVVSAPDHPLTGARHRVATMKMVDTTTQHGNPMDTIGLGDVMKAVNEALVTINPPPVSCPAQTLPYLPQAPGVAI